jgi:hypothetical protein
MVAIGETIDDLVQQFIAQQMIENAPISIILTN